MSLPFYDLACSHCSYKSEYSHHIDFEFEGGCEATCQPNLSQSWCYQCNEVRTVCSSQTTLSNKYDIDRFNHLIAKENANKNKRKFIFFKVKVDEELIKNYSEKLDSIYQCIKYYELNSSPDKCLTCGSTILTNITFPSRDSTWESLNVQHDCGGKILAKRIGRMSFAGGPKVVYDMFGKVKFDER